MGNLSIRPGAALDDAKSIDVILTQIEDDMKKLDGVIRSVIPDKVRTDWSESVRANWQRYYSEDVPNALMAIKTSATNLRLAVEEATQYSRGQ